MMTVADLQSQVDRILAHPPRRPAAVAVDAAGGLPASPVGRFTSFNLLDAFQSHQLADELVRQASASNGGEPGVAAALAHAERELARPDQDPGLVKHAVKLFLTHYPHGTPIRIKGLEAREPEKILPSIDPLDQAERERAIAANPELRLAWFREDPKCNEHHEHWHVVYPPFGVPDPDSPVGGKLKERQGELFLYMHQQMLARYNTERLALGMEQVTPWLDYSDASDPYGYDPGKWLRPYFSERLPNQKMRDIPETRNPSPNWKIPRYHVSVARLWQLHQELEQAARTGRLRVADAQGHETAIAVDAENFGATQEADIGSVVSVPYQEQWDQAPLAIEEFFAALYASRYGNHHNDGHDVFAYMSVDPVNRPGVMGFTATAIRDHLFFRWHKTIDDLSVQWQETQPPNDFADAPPVVIRKSLPGAPSQPNQSPDIILCLKDDLLPWDDWSAFGRTAFGGANWDRAFDRGAFTTAEGIPFGTTDELRTQMQQRVITIETGREDPSAPEQAHVIEYLDQREFFYFLRLENQADAAKEVTVRIFLAAADPLRAPHAAEDRRLWIEMDKFRQALAPRERAVVFRPASLSSVIRKPAVKPPSAEQPPVSLGSRAIDPQRAAETETSYCDCGWPYNLLLPRGTPAGMRFRLLVFLTDWELDRVPDDSCCGSMSYCGAKERYPDRRSMGYPFDRRFPTATIAETIARQPNMATRDIVIRFLD